MQTTTAQDGTVLPLDPIFSRQIVVTTDLGVQMTIPVINSYVTDLPVLRQRFEAILNLQLQLDISSTTIEISKDLEQKDDGSVEFL